MTEHRAAASGSARISAVVLTWNTAELAIQTMESLASGYTDGLRVVLVDNGSVDDSVEVIQAFLNSWEHSSAVTFIRSPENLGFPGGVNLGTEAALAAEPPPDYIWTLNPDAFVNAATPKEMAAVALESGAEIVGVGTSDRAHIAANAWPRIFFMPPNRCATVPELGARWWPAGRYGGSCALFDAKLVRRLIQRDGAFMDASLFLDWDEWEVTRRAASLGASVVLAGRAHQEHDDAFRTFGKSPMAKARQYYQSRNAVAVSRRFMPWWQFWPLLPLHIARDVSWFARVRLGGERPNLRPYLTGVVDGLRGKSGRWERHPPTPTQGVNGPANTAAAWKVGPEPPTEGAARVTAVVLTWNTPNLAIQTLESLAGGFGDGLHVVLVDNGSIDDSATVIEGFLGGWEHSAGVSFVRSAENLGFTGGVNLGVTAALEADLPPDYIWMLNPDAVVSPATVNEMVAVVRESGSPIVSSGGTDETYVGEDAWPQVAWARPQTIDRPMRTDIRWWRVGRYNGASALFDARLVRELIRRDGYFQDPELFLDWDEWDTARRAASLGAFVVHARDAAFSHPDYARSLGKSAMAAVRQYYMSRNEIIVSRRYMPRRTFWLSLPLHLGRDLTWFVRLRRHGVHPNERAYFQGVIDGLRGKSGKWEKHPLDPFDGPRHGAERATATLKTRETDPLNLDLVTVVIVVWNSGELAKESLQSLAGAFAAGLRAVVVDNGSADGSGATIQTFLDAWLHRERVTLLRSAENLGFTGGVNLGTATALAADSPPLYVWLLNPDAVVNPDTIQELVSVARESRAEIVTAGGAERHVGKGATWPRTFWWPPVRGRRETARERWWPSEGYSGSCVIFESGLVRRLIETAGHFQDDSLFMYWDERDTMLRAWSLGARAVASRDADIKHAGGNTRGSANAAAARQYYLSRNSILVARRHLSKWQFCWMVPFHLARDLVWLARLRVQGKSPNETAYVRGVLDGLRGRSGKWVHHPESPANA